MEEDKKRTLVLEEKYRPKSFNGFVGNNEIVSQIKALVESGNVPSMTFAGEVGIGKTTMAYIIRNELQRKKWGGRFMEFNASHERGIETVRTKIKDLAKQKGIGRDYNIIFLDECDGLTKDAQNALRRIIERNHRFCRFILSCNEPQKLIPAIQDRCPILSFERVRPRDMLTRLQYIVEREKINIKAEQLKKLCDVSEGSMRYAIKKLGMFKVLKRQITNDDIERKIETKIIGNLMKNIMEGKSFFTIRSIAIRAMKEYGRDQRGFLKDIHLYVMPWKPLPSPIKVKIMLDIAKYDYQMTMGASKVIQLDAFLASLWRLVKKYAKNKKEREK